MSELKRCPFCSGKALMRTKFGVSELSKSVWCGKCGASSYCYDTDEAAVFAWNRRAGEEERNSLVLMASDAICREADLRPRVTALEKTVEENFGFTVDSQHQADALLKRVEALEKGGGE